MTVQTTSRAGCGLGTNTTQHLQKMLAIGADCLGSVGVIWVAQFIGK